ncbi:hypothetical protein LTS10_008044 [Elasticomyces elasticus]|nr:hypothetical protein LTS10_008044 [Elasticomyces elasticus]
MPPSSVSGSERRTNIRRDSDVNINKDAPFERPRMGPPPLRPRPKKFPQQIVDEFWSNFNSKFPGKITTVLPDKFYAKRIAQRPDADEGSHNAVDSYEEASKICRQKVDKIVGECRRLNQKYRDPHFDVEDDFYQNAYQECLHGLIEKKNEPKLVPKSVKRVGDIFEKPQFFIKGATANDVRQGRNGDCWLLAALGTVSNCQGLIEKVCVHSDPIVGVYGFVFQRDGAWISEVVDDKLYLINEDWYDRNDRNDPNGGINNWMQVQDRKDVEKEYKKRFQTGSKALYFAQCSDPNETWLPLLEKAFAKAHGDYLAVEGGFVGEAIEDLTGGVTSEMHGTDILDRDAFWTNELLQVNKLFLFGCGQSRGFDEDRNGIQHRHAYSVMEAREVDGLRLVKLRNPWGNTEWTGAWSDGSEEWTAEWLQKLGHKFGNDGVFWISYDDMLNVYQHFDRTRLFNDQWRITQQWVSLQVPWSTDYHDTHFLINVAKPGDVVIVLSQLDDRYYRGLEGPYNFKLHFRVHKQGETDYLVRSPFSYNMRRSISTEVYLDPGTYMVMVKIEATRVPFKMTTEDVVRLAATRNRRAKLLNIGLSHDLAYAKVQLKEHDDMIESHEKKARKSKRREDAKAAKEMGRKLRERDRALRKKTREKLEAKRKAHYAEQPAETLDEDIGRAGPADDAAGEADSVIEANGPAVPPAERETQVMDGAEVSSPDVVHDAGREATTLPEQVSTAPGSEGNTAATQETVHPIELSNGASRVQDSLPPQPEGDEEARTVPPPTQEALNANIRGQQNDLPIRGPPPPRPFSPSLRRPTEFGDPYADSPEDWQQGPFDRRRRSDVPPPGSRIPPYRQATFATEHRERERDDFDSRDLSWDSELDAPTDSDEEHVQLARTNPFLNPPPPSNGPPLLLDEPEDSEFASEPWNAVCVVGLRVYAKVDNDVSVEVVRAGMAEEKQGAGGVRALDRDDPAVDHTEQGASI